MRAMSRIGEVEISSIVSPALHEVLEVCLDYGVGH